MSPVVMYRYAAFSHNAPPEVCGTEARVYGYSYTELPQHEFNGVIDRHHGLAARIPSPLLYE